MKVDKDEVRYKALKRCMTGLDSVRQVARDYYISHVTILNWIKKVKENGFASWEDIKDLKPSEFNEIFAVTRSPSLGIEPIDLHWVHELMQTKGQTKRMCWEIYSANCAKKGIAAYAYSSLCEQYDKFKKSLSLSMRMTHIPGDNLFVDFAGTTLEWTDKKTGEKHKVQIFVAVMGYSKKVFAFAVASQKIEDWILAHIKAFKYFGGVPKRVVPDNLKAAVIAVKPHLKLNKTYTELSDFYDFVISPARVRKPQDKSLAELGVLWVTRWILAPLSRRQFFSLAEMNEAIAELLELLNQRPFKRYPGNRNTRFEEREKQCLAHLPSRDFIYGEWTGKLKVGEDYHVYVHSHAYSVSYKLAHQYVTARITQDTVTIYHDGSAHVTHQRSFEKGGHTTLHKHRHPDHKAYAKMTHEYFYEWARHIGINAMKVVEAQFKRSKSRSDRAAKNCKELQAICNQYTPQDFEQACSDALYLQSPIVKTVLGRLQSGLRPIHAKPEQEVLPPHENIRNIESFRPYGGVV